MHGLGKKVVSQERLKRSCCTWSHRRVDPWPPRRRSSSATLPGRSVPTPPGTSRLSQERQKRRHWPARVDADAVAGLKRSPKFWKSSNFSAAFLTFWCGLFREGKGRRRCRHQLRRQCHLGRRRRRRRRHVGCQSSLEISLSTSSTIFESSSDEKTFSGLFFFSNRPPIRFQSKKIFSVCRNLKKRRRRDFRSIALTSASTSTLKLKETKNEKGVILQFSFQWLKWSAHNGAKWVRVPLAKKTHKSAPLPWLYFVLWYFEQFVM